MDFLFTTKTIMAQHNDTGQWGEDLAVQHLKSKGYTIRDRNWRSGHREIDIIALTEDMRTLVFVEVKTRSENYLLAPEVAIDRQKIRNIGYVANSYIKQNRIRLNCRFDVITIIGNKNEGIPIIKHWENAFNPMVVY